MKKMKRREYDEALEALQVQLVNMQHWVRDSAGKGGTIKALTERVSPRVFRVVALPKPSDREASQWYFQRYIEHLPASGEVVLFDRSWYNRAGVERVMGFCTDAQYRRFLATCPGFESTLIESGIVLVKYWLSITDEAQRKRFQSRIDDPRKRWKLSPMDLEARRRWYAYSQARDAMMTATDTGEAPWYVVDANDQRRARLNCINHLLSLMRHDPVPHDPPELPARDSEDAYDDVRSLSARRCVPEVY